MISVSVPVGAAALGAGASLIGSSNSANAAKSAANTQAAAAERAAQIQMDQFNRTATNMSPFLGTGVSALGIQGGLLGLPGYENLMVASHAPGTGNLGDDPGPITLANSGNAFSFGGSAPGSGARLGFGSMATPFAPTMAQLEATPGYQFAKTQGLQAVQNASVAQGLSGSAVKGAASFAEGLASTTFNQQQQNYWNNLNNIWEKVSQVTGSGQNAAAQLGGFGQSTANNVSSLATAAGAAQAGGTVGAANALNSGLSGASGAINNGALLALLGNNGFFGNQNASSFAPFVANSPFNVGGTLQPFPTLGGG